MGRLIDGDELVLWLTKWMMSSFGAVPTEETEAIRKVCDAVGDMVKDLAKDTGGDLISRQAAIDAIHCNIVVTGKRNSEVVASTIGMFVDRIKALPSAEPKTGQWIKIGEITDSKGIKKHVLNCPECGALHRVRKLWTGEYVNAEYCPHCGVRMKGADDESTI